MALGLHWVWALKLQWAGLVALGVWDLRYPTEDQTSFPALQVDSLLSEPRRSLTGGVEQAKRNSRN